MGEAGAVIAKAGGALDGVALGEWVHAGDVREALGEPGAYGGPGLPYALALLTRLSRERGMLPVHADVDELDEPLKLGDASGSGRRGGTSGTRPRLCGCTRGGRWRVRVLGRRRMSWRGWRRGS